MARGGVPTKPPVFRTLDWGALVRNAWGDEWLKKETVYEFGNGRKFVDPGASGGPYTGTSGNG
jgi:hypothetical protein